MTEVQKKTQLFGRSVEKSLTNNFALGLCIVQPLSGHYFDLSDEVVSEGMWQFCEILSVEAHIQHVERTLIAEMRNIRDLAADDITVVVALAADPVLVVLCLGLFRSGLTRIRAFETYSYVIEIF